MCLEGRPSLASWSSDSRSPSSGGSMSTSICMEMLLPLSPLWLSPSMSGLVALKAEKEKIRNLSWCETWINSPASARRRQGKIFPISFEISFTEYNKSCGYRKLHFILVVLSEDLAGLSLLWLQKISVQLPPRWRWGGGYCEKGKYFPRASLIPQDKSFH